MDSSSSSYKKRLSPELSSVFDLENVRLFFHGQSSQQLLNTCCHAGAVSQKYHQNLQHNFIDIKF